MKPSNPCKWYNGNKEVTFTYEGGSIPYYFFPSKECSPLLDHWIPISILVFANSVEEAKDIIEKLLVLRKKVNTHGASHRMQLIDDLLKNRHKWIVKEASRNQVYSIGWADNDTIL